MSNPPHYEKMKHFGETIYPVSHAKIKQIAGCIVEESYGTYRIWGSTNSSDFSFGRIDERGYVAVEMNPPYVYQFHPGEWPAIEGYLVQSPFIEDFGHDVKRILSNKTWEKQYASRYEDDV